MLVLGCVLSIIGTIFVFQFKGIREDLGNMNNSVATLNEQIAVVIKDQQWHKEEIDFIKQRLTHIEG